MVRVAKMVARMRGAAHLANSSPMPYRPPEAAAWHASHGTVNAIRDKACTVAGFGGKFRKKVKEFNQDRMNGNRQQKPAEAGLFTEQ